MNNKKIGIIVIIIIIIVIIISGFLVFNNTDNKTHVIEIEGGKFNCSENINFTLKNSTKDYFKEYRSEDDRFTVKVTKYDLAEYWWLVGFEYADKEIKQYPSIVVDNIRIYNTTANTGKYIGEVRYISIIDNQDKSLNIQITTPTVEETVKIAKTFEFT